MTTVFSWHYLYTATILSTGPLRAMTITWSLQAVSFVSIIITVTVQVCSLPPFHTSVDILIRFSGLFCLSPMDTVLLACSLNPVMDRFSRYIRSISTQSRREQLAKPHRVHCSISLARLDRLGSDCRCGRHQHQWVMPVLVASEKDFQDVRAR